MKHYDFLIIGGGIFGMTTAIELAKRKYQVGLINPDSIPHHLAASTDVTKIVRMEYGSDSEYFRMAEICLDRWRAWNELFEETLFHEVGFLMLCQTEMEHARHDYEKASCQQLLKSGYALDRLDAKSIRERFPAFNSNTYVDGNFNPKAGYVEASLAIEYLADYARTLGVEIHEGQTASKFVIEGSRLKAVVTKEGETFQCGHAIVAAGAHTPYLLPELQPYMKITGHPVFWLKPQEPEVFFADRFPVFTADISNTGWYGFPFLAKQGIIKVAKHSNGLAVDPDRTDRQITDEEVHDLRLFLHKSIPSLAKASLVYTRRCLYTDTLDGHFWIDQHPDIKGLTVSTGGSGHGLKMGPIIGEMTADVAEGKKHQFSERYRWRELSDNTSQAEEARFVVNRKL